MFADGPLEAKKLKTRIELTQLIGLDCLKDWKNLGSDGRSFDQLDLSSICLPVVVRQ